ncbi:MAG TPA: transketolase C-terminal domain-containing protein, partial [Terriglobales bacterium]|nr:transketolase C-terminal domain-containing protein [Terriglobales bacterium]
MREIAYYEAKFEALHEIMAADERVHLINGTFLSLSPHRHVYQELVKKYRDRIMSPPISELGFCGLATGAAMAGLRPIVDISTGSFIFEGWPQVANEAANAFYMSGGQTRVPVVFHLFHGLRGGGASQHSASPQAMLWNNPGLEIALPSSPRDVKGLLKTAVASDNPTIFVDHVQLLEVRGDVPEKDAPIPFGVADVKRQGDDVTVIATSYIVQRCLQVAEKLSTEKISVEVLDPRTLVPFDMTAVMTSVEKTGRVVIVDETHQSCGVAAEIAARIAETGFDKLKAPLRRVATLDVPVPYSPPLEEYIGP